MATLKDVAKETGLATGTVSRVLNNRGYISDDARKKVDDAMKKLNYQPNEVARSLHRKSTNTIGLIVPHIRHPYFSEMISNLEDQAYKKGYKIMLCNSQSIDEKEKEYLNMCTGNQVAGIILCSGSVSVRLFGETDIPVITMERFLDNGTASVECDNRQGGILAAEKLIACGCKHLIHVGNISSIEMPADIRTEGFREICEKNGVSFVELLTEEKHYYSMTYTDMIEEALLKYPKTDGLFANSDVIAAQTLQVCRKLGISVPDQLKIIGFDDVRIAALTTPQLTTIHQPVREMAEIAINLLHDAVSGKLVPKRTVLPVALIERETTV
ncbi:MAG: LacI family transcriptional regulator [Lachnospiraceae bacterium]|jgi:LacI family sucrose operon transcriptional repressor|nr:LacI family transcriptional regulator [Lachnospiraceae bacterium]